MTSETYFKRADAMSAAKLAGLLGISPGRMSQLRKSKDWPAPLALLAEEKTGGAMNASALSSVVAQARETGAAA